MVLNVIAAAILAVGRALGGGAGNIMRTSSRSASKPRDLIDIAAKAVLPYDIADLKRHGASHLIDRFAPPFSRPITKLVDKSKDKLKQPPSQREYVVEIQCTTSQTGHVNTHTYLVLEKDLADFLENPAKSVRDVGDSGSSGEDGKDVGMNVRIK